MQDVISQINVGVVTGVLTTILIFFVKSIWVSKVTPFLESVQYKGVLVDGTWHGENTETSDEGVEIYNKCILQLTQKAHSLSGTFLFTYKAPDNEFTLNFNVTGYMWEGYLTLNFTPTDRRVTSYGTSLLKLHGGGIVLVGAWCFRDVGNEIVDTVSLTLMRESSSPNKG